MDTGAGGGPHAPAARTPADSRPRPSPGPRRSLPGGPRRWRGSQPLAHAGREDAQLVAVLRDRSPRDLDALLREHLHDLLVGERVPGVLVGHHLLICARMARALASSPVVVERPLEKKNLS